MIRQFRALILGAPGSGKGTISSRIIRKFDIKHIASGDILRNNILNKTELGNTAKTYMDKGQLVPNDIMVNLITDELNQNSKVNWLLDGFPRTRTQAEILSKKVQVDVALNLVVPFDVIIARIQQRWIHAPSGRVYNTDFNAPKVPGHDDITGEKLVQRDDDKPEAVSKRLEIYSQTVKPVLDFYKDAGILEEFHGKTSDEMWPLIFKFLSSRTPCKADLNDAK
ncbi:GTP:AMP phosphotransferase AK3, mitochondrial-like [Nilaparvata lugens]|uniref:GTP:AMP phosphotransferase AK3, mitochondrial-like n=1 Tax=Nilaparvata lugens TaxID=108931 RepID=UPI000B99659C|nr:GTP:AMP phosphotransferase AK3, mitochondrial-like [Nilaparvata lugens]